MVHSRFLAAVAAIIALPVAPALAQGPLHVNLSGFQRAVPYVTSGGDNCEVLPPYGASTTVNCPDGSKGTITLYGQSEDTPVCEVDFWTQGGRWHATLAHQNGGSCALNWNNGSLNVTAH
jgi:hypothetical protein